MSNASAAVIRDGTIPLCPVCTDVLGSRGGPCSLPCGHNGCFFCLRDVQVRKPDCPLCRAPFSPDLPLLPNPDLRELVAMAKFSAGCLEEEGWESMPTRARAVRLYAQDLNGTLQSAASEAAGAGAPSSGEPSRAGGLDVNGGAEPAMSIVTGSYHTAAAPGTRYPYESILAWTPPQWMPDSCAPACKACCKPFRAVVRLRHHCRLCGLIFCHSCSSNKLLLPPKFGHQEPQRVCDNCYDVLKPAELQNALAGHFSKAAQQPIHDVTDWTSVRAWLNSPLFSSLEADIFKSTNIIRQFVASSRLHAERAIPATLLQNAAGYVVLSVLKVGMGWSVSVGSGLLVARRQDGSWSPPSAVGVCSLGWGFQAGGELTDVLLVLSNTEAVAAFCGDVLLGMAGNVAVSLGPLGRDASASIRVGQKGYALAYSYSCSRGMFVGVSVDGSVMHSRTAANVAFYGRPLTVKDLVLGGCVDPPPAARTLYDALDCMVNSFGQHAVQVAPLFAPLAATPRQMAYLVEEENLSEDTTGSPPEKAHAAASTSAERGGGEHAPPLAAAADIPMPQLPALPRGVPPFPSAPPLPDVDDFEPASPSSPVMLALGDGHTSGHTSGSAPASPRAEAAAPRAVSPAVTRVVEASSDSDSDSEQYMASLFD